MRTAQMIALVFLGTLAVATAQDVSVVLANYPQFSKFNEYLKTTGVLAEVNMRNSMTILLPEDGILNGFVGSHPTYTTQMLADVIRYHCLLQYFGGEELATITPEKGGVVTTLYQTTGRANGLDGFVNITALPDGTRTVGPSTPGTPPQANILTNVTQYPYNYSFLQISAVLQPLGLAAAQLAPTTPPMLSPVPAPAPIDAPVMAPVVAPVAAPVEAPIAAPVEAPVAAPVEAPVAAPVEAPVAAPVEAPVAAPVEAPVAAPVEAPVAAPVEAPVAAPVEAPVAAPVEAPVATPVEAPVAAPVEAPVAAPVKAPVASPPAVNGPVASALDAPSSGSLSASFNAAALVASSFVAALLL